MLLGCFSEPSHPLRELRQLPRHQDLLLGLSIALGSQSVLKAAMQSSCKSFCTLNMRVSELIFDVVSAFPGSSVPLGNEWPHTGAEMLEEGKDSLAIPRHGSSLVVVAMDAVAGASSVLLTPLL